MEQAENVIYRQRKWALGRWITAERADSREGFSRVEYADSTHISYRGDGYETLRLYPAAKRAVLEKWNAVPRMRRDSHENGPVERIATYHKRNGFSFVRRDRYEDKDVAIYESRGKTDKSYRWITWVDLETELPLHIEIYRGETIRSGGGNLYGLRVDDFLPPGSPRSAAAGWIDIDPNEPDMICDDFRWNTQSDTSYFSLIPPPGYQVSMIDSIWDVEEWEKKFAAGTPGEAEELAKVFSLWLSLSGGAFPENIHDLKDSSMARRLLIAKHDKDGKPGDELRAAVADAWLLHMGRETVRHYDDNLHYVGRGAGFGDSTRIVCWGEITGRARKIFDNPYWIIYADLRCVPSSKRPGIPDD